jgi:peptide/nickel transport system substrate-binding protein
MARRRLKTDFLTRRGALALFGGAAIGFASSRVSAQGAHKVLTIGLNQFPGIFHSGFALTTSTDYILSMTRRPLVAYDAAWKLVPMLAAEVPTEANGLMRRREENGRTIVEARFTLSPAACWADGTPVSTKDILFSLKVGKDERIGYVSTSIYRAIESIAAESDTVFTVRFAQAPCDMATMADFLVLPAHVEGKRFEADPLAYKARTAYDTDTINPGLYHGPYRIAELRKGDSVVVVRNEHWKGQKPYFDRIVLRAIENSAALQNNLLSGAVDYLPGELGLAVDQAMALEQRAAGRFVVRYNQGLTHEQLGIDMLHPILSDVRVRRAIAHAIDKDTINQQLWGGKHMPSAWLRNPRDPVHTDDVVKYPYDPARAAALLEEAGWKKGADGIRANAKGERLRFALTGVGGNRAVQLTQQIVQAQLKAVGIDLELRSAPARVLFGEITQQRKTGGMLLYAYKPLPGGNPRNGFHSSQIPRPETNYAGQNFFGWSNAEVDRTTDALLDTCEPQARSALWKKLQQVFAEEVPVIPLFFRAEADIMPPWLSGIVPTGHSHLSTLWVETWSATA